MTDATATIWSGSLKNGLPVTVRPIRPDDRSRIARAFAKLDRESVYTRAFTYKAILTEAELDRIVNVDPAQGLALVVTTGSGADETVIATARYIESPARAGRRSAEVAFVVEEDYQGLGIAGRLLGALARLAREHGIDRFEAEVLAENRPMLAVFAKSALPMIRRTEDGVVLVELDLAGAAAKSA